MLASAQNSVVKEKHTSTHIMADVETDSGASSKGGSKKKFEVKKWNAVALWAWGMCCLGCLKT